MLFWTTGASGAGKSACLEGLKAAHPDIAWYEFDSVGVPAPCPPAWRAKTTEHWIRVAIANQELGRGGLDTGVVGGAIPGEVLASPSAPEVVGGIRFLLLDCHDVTRIDRLRARGMGGDTQDMLSWAAWQRVHAVDPQWRPDVIRNTKAWDDMHWERWADWQRGDQRWAVATIDNTHLSVPETVAAISAWLANNRNPERNWRFRLLAEGYALFPCLASPDLMDAAREAVEVDLAANYDPGRQREYDRRSYCPDLLGTPPVMDLLNQTPLAGLFNICFGEGSWEADRGQVALRRARQVPSPVPPVPHVDGGWSSLGEPLSPGANPTVHLAIAGIFLTDLKSGDTGNLAVWPGSHQSIAAYFREHGIEAIRQGLPALSSFGVSSPLQLLPRAGDAVIMHGLLSHAAVANASTDDRLAIYFRAWPQSAAKADLAEKLRDVSSGWCLSRQVY